MYLLDAREVSVHVDPVALESPAENEKMLPERVPPSTCEVAGHR